MDTTPQPLSADDVATLALIAPELEAPVSDLLTRLLRERGRLRVTARALLSNLPPDLQAEAEELSRLVGPPT